MAFAGRYIEESKENYEEFLEATGYLGFKTDQQVETEVIQDGNDFTWTQKLPNCSWSNSFTAGGMNGLTNMAGELVKTMVFLDNGKLSISFPKYLCVFELINDKLVMTCTVHGAGGVTFKRISKRI